MSSIPTHDHTPQDIELLVRREQAAVLLSSLRLTMAGNSFIASSIVLLYWDELPRAVLLGWFGLVLLLNLIRLVSGQILRRRQIDLTRPTFVMNVIASGAGVSGLLWASFLIYADQNDLTLGPSLNVLYCGIITGALILGAAHRRTVFSFTYPILITHFTLFAIHGSISLYLVALNILFFLYIVTRAAIRFEGSFLGSHRLKHESVQLAASLRSANALASRAMHRLEFNANHDSLTGLSNRMAFRSTFETLLAQARLDGSEIAVMLVDLDRFKAINDTFGHAAGDEVLTAVSQRLRDILEPSDVIARLGGDEFAILMHRTIVASEDREVAANILDIVPQPIRLAERLVQVGASIGISQFPRDGSTVDELQICADVALYAAKSDGRRTFRSFDAELRAVADARRVFQLDFGAALESGAIEVWFQPQIRYASQRVYGLEALVRWNHPNHGWVAPPEIVKAAAATRQSQALTHHVLTASCQMLQLLDGIGRKDIVVSFNVSPGEFGIYSIADLIRKEITALDVEPGRLEVELTEESMYSEERSGDDLRALASMGVRIAVDDFGTGYSSFGSLRNLQFDCIKIDRSFVGGIAERREDRALVQAIIAVARALKVETIAEGVETAEQVAVLGSLGCQILQGFHYAKAMPAPMVLRWISLRDTAEADTYHTLQEALAI